jgi:hypothetical protein
LQFLYPLCASSVILGGVNQMTDYTVLVIHTLATGMMQRLTWVVLLVADIAVVGD